MDPSSKNAPDDQSPPTTQQSSQEANRWYLAYGSNLSSAVFQGQRGIRPLASHVIRAPNLEMVFDLRGIPYWEPGFANLRQTTPLVGLANVMPFTKGLIGVVYSLTPEDYRKVIATEGAGAVYQEHVVECFRIPSEMDCDISADPIVDDSAHSPNPDSRIFAYTLLAPDVLRSRTPLEPSKRYIDILRAGAREHHLPADYIAYLDAVSYYKRVTVGQNIGGAMFLAVWTIPLLIIMTLTTLFADKITGHSPDWLLKYQQFLSRTMWLNYEHAWKPLFGSGEVKSKAFNANAAIAVPGETKNEVDEDRTHQNSMISDNLIL